MLLVGPMAWNSPNVNSFDFHIRHLYYEKKIECYGCYNVIVVTMSLLLLIRRSSLLNKLIPPQQMGTASGARDGVTQSQHYAMRALKKVPEVTVYFWIIKLLTTGMGETTSDYLVRQLNPILAVALGGIG